MGTLKFIFTGGAGYTWESILLDYSLAYMAVGLSGLLRGRVNLAWLGALIGCFARFFIHFLSGVTIYAASVEPIFGWDGKSAAIYSILYNGSYMLPNTILTVVLILLCQKFWVGGVQPGGVVLCIIFFNTPVDTYISYSINRIVDTGLGVLIALFVNWAFSRERVEQFFNRKKADENEFTSTQ